MVKGISLHIGICQVNRNYYSEGLDRLFSPENDAILMKSICRQNDFSESTLLLGKNANRKYIYDAINYASQQLESEDIFCISYSGHGGRMPKSIYDPSFQGYFETWCLSDGLFFDIELTKLWSYFKAGTRILVVSDSCHSGGIVDNTKALIKPRTKAVKDTVTISTFHKNESQYKTIIYDALSRSDLKTSVKLLAACGETETTSDGDTYSEFTRKLKLCWNDGEFDSDYQNFRKQISEISPRKEAEIVDSGIPNEKFNNQKPFQI